MIVVTSLYDNPYPSPNDDDDDGGDGGDDDDDDECRGRKIGETLRDRIVSLL